MRLGFESAHPIDEVADWLNSSGAPIGEMNTVRKHLSRIKGGRLAAACAPARVVTLTISDVPGDDVSVIAKTKSFQPSWSTWPDTPPRTDKALPRLPSADAAKPEAWVADALFLPDTPEGLAIACPAAQPLAQAHWKL